MKTEYDKSHFPVFNIVSINYNVNLFGFQQRPRVAKYKGRTELVQEINVEFSKTKTLCATLLFPKLNTGTPHAKV